MPIVFNEIIYLYVFREAQQEEGEEEEEEELTADTQPFGCESQSLDAGGVQKMDLTAKKSPAAAVAAAAAAVDCASPAWSVRAGKAKKVITLIFLFYKYA